jgi:hypothetical protein
MRRSAFVLASVLMVAACGSSGLGAADTLPPPATDGSTGTSTPTTTEPDRATTDTTEPGTRPEDPPEPVAPPEDDQGPIDEPPVRLSIEDALLPDEALPPPWEPQWRRLDRIGYPAGANQTDCDEYWEYESLLGSAAAEALWWMDGGNANHYVVRMDGEAEILTTLISIASIAANCPTVTWNEGGSFTTEMIEFDDAIGLRFDDAASGEVTWVLLTTFGDLVSVLSMPLWTPADGDLAEPSSDELSRLASLIYDRLEAAGAAEEPVDVSTTEPPPIVAPPTTDPPVEVTGTGELLLGESDLPEGWALAGLEISSPSPTDQEVLDECPAAASIDLVDLGLEWEAEYESVFGSSAFELIGEMDSAAEASAAIEQFSTVWECDLGVLIEGATTSGGPVVLAGADAAGRLVLEAPDLLDARAELVLAAIGNVVIVVSEEIPAGGTSSVIELAQLAVDKIVAAS